MTKVRTQLGRSSPVLVAVTAAAVTLAACGSSGTKAASSSSSSSSGASGASGSTPAVPAPTGTPINIGVIGGQTGSQASSSSQGATVAPAWEKWVNESLGGISGHPVKVTVVNDAEDPAKAAAAGTQLESAGVVAIVVASDNLLPAYAAQAKKKGIPLISGTANAVTWYTQTGLYPTVTDVLSGLAAQVAVAKQFGKATKFANLYCAENPACAKASPILEGAAKKAGVGIISLAISASATSYTAQCLKMKQEKVDYAQLNMSGAIGAKVVQDCETQGYTPTWGTSSQALGKDLLAASKAKFFGPAYAFPTVADAPAITTFRDTMTKFAKDDNWHEGAAAFTWTGLEALRKALASAPATVTSSTVTAGLNAFKGENLGGLAANKLTYSASKPVAFSSQPCYFVIGAADGKTVAPNGATPVCPSA